MSSPAVCDWVVAHARRSPDAPAIDSPQHRLSYAALAERIGALAHELGAMGIGPGDRVLVLLPNLPATVVVSLAIQYVGATSVEVSRDLAFDMLAFVVRQSGPRAVAFAARDARKLAALLREASVAHALVVHDGDLPEALRPCLTGLEVTQMMEDGALTRAAGSEREARVAPVRDRSTVTQILYTSGSTGQPRGVMQTIGNIEANTRSIVEYLGLTADDRAMLILPLSYCYGRSVVQTHLFAGGSVFLDGRFMYPQVVLDAMGSERCTGFAGVPLTFELLQRQAKPDMHALAALRYITHAGGPLDKRTADWVRTAFRPAQLFTMYGQTEATARLSYVPPDRSDKRDSIGIPIPGVELRIVDEDGSELPVGVQGELVARGANITPGYYKMPDESARILASGWLRTGDLGHRDQDGYFYLVGRAKEILKIGGHRVSPAQIEATLAGCEGVSEVAVAGTADRLMGEVPVALVVVEAGSVLSELDLRKFCAARLPAYMVPRVVGFASALPRGPSGKLLRAEVSRLLTHVQQQQRSTT
ncbi:MAG TPA: class I adenylate-forming enzyme family protein [Polyangiaceae bacterium]|nr:class I adenylate-forming enzyme family protein [Polyangiaceae bacterium]